MYAYVGSVFMIQSFNYSIFFSNINHLFQCQIGFVTEDYCQCVAMDLVRNIAGIQLRATQDKKGK